MEQDYILPNEGVYSQITHLVKVSVLPSYLEEHSDPLDYHYVWAYTIQIENLSQKEVQLVRRYWHITDANGQIQEVRGEGVVGEQPRLKPNEGFRYTSGVSLMTSSGMMTGHYEMTDQEENSFLIDIPSFSLDSPAQMQRPN